MCFERTGSTYVVLPVCTKLVQHSERARARFVGGRSYVMLVTVEVVARSESQWSRDYSDHQNR